MRDLGRLGTNTLMWGDCEERERGGGREEVVGERRKRERERRVRRERESKKVE